MHIQMQEINEWSRRNMISHEFPEIRAAARLWNEDNAVGRDNGKFSLPTGFKNIFTWCKLF